MAEVAKRKEVPVGKPAPEDDKESENDSEVLNTITMIQEMFNVTITYDIARMHLLKARGNPMTLRRNLKEGKTMNVTITHDHEICEKKIPTIIKGDELIAIIKSSFKYVKGRIFMIRIGDKNSPTLDTITIKEKYMFEYGLMSDSKIYIELV